MRSRLHIRARDLNYVAIIQSPVLWLCQHWLAAWSKDPRHAAWVPTVPDWAFPFSLGIALATLWYDVLFRDHSRIRELWHWLFDVFTVEFVNAGRWMDLPESDMGVRAAIRFRRHVRNATVSLRVFSVVGRGRKPYHELIKYETRDFESGEKVILQIATLGIPSPTWDHTRPRGWGPQRDNMPAFLGPGGSIAIIECRHGLLRQQFKLYVDVVQNPGTNDVSPRIYLQDQDDEVFDTSDANKLGYNKYAQ